MTGIFVSRSSAGKPHCARCGRPFTPRKEGDRYGWKCAKKAACDHLEVKNTKGETVAVII